jgi:hypothetical protein
MAPHTLLLPLHRRSPPPAPSSPPVEVASPSPLLARSCPLLVASSPGFLPPAPSIPSPGTTVESGLSIAKSTAHTDSLSLAIILVISGSEAASGNHRGIWIIVLHVLHLFWGQFSVIGPRSLSPRALGRCSSPLLAPAPGPPLPVLPPVTPSLLASGSGPSTTESGGQVLFHPREPLRIFFALAASLPALPLECSTWPHFTLHLLGCC